MLFNHRLSIRITDLEYDYIEKIALDKGISKVEVIRYALELIQDLDDSNILNDIKKQLKNR